MTERVKEDKGLIEEIGMGPKQIDRPVFVVHMVSTPDGDKQQYLLHLSECDPLLQDPRVYGIVISDLIDHIAAGYRDTTGRDERDIREAIMRVIRDENRFKENDPRRGGMRGATLMPKAN